MVVSVRPPLADALLVQQAQLAVVQVVRGDPTRRVVGVEDRIGDELADVIVL